MITTPILNNLFYNCRIPVYDWGKRQAKTLDDLSQEIARGESWLQLNQDGVSRFVEIVTANILSEDEFNPRGHIIEVGQYGPDDRYRELNRLPSGRIRKGEDPQSALIRMVQQKLGFTPEMFAPSGPYSEQKITPSYPGLTSFYTIRQFNVVILPQGFFEQKDFEILGKNKIRYVFKWSN